MLHSYTTAFYRIERLGNHNKCDFREVWDALGVNHITSSTGKIVMQKVWCYYSGGNVYNDHLFVL